MSDTPEIVNVDWERYRSHLLMLARLHLDTRLRGKVDPSDVVQQTLLRAYQAQGELVPETSGAVAAWLRKILARQLMNATRTFQANKRHVAREQSLESQWDASSARMVSWLAVDGSRPCDRLTRDEQLVRLSDACEQLPADYREAIVLRYFVGIRVDEIGTQMGRSRAAVAGLLRRGLELLRGTLRTEMPDV